MLVCNECIKKHKLVGFWCRYDGTELLSNEHKKEYISQMTNSNICLVSVRAAHYRKQIYYILEKELSCDFIFGVDNIPIKRLDISLYKHTSLLPNKYIGKTNCFFQKGLLANTINYNTIISDLSTLCISSWLLLIRGKVLKQKIYCWDHGWYGREGKIKKWIKRVYFGLAEGTFLYGNYAKTLMIQNGFNEKKLFVIHNSLEYDLQLELRKKMKHSKLFISHFNNTNPVICFVGRLTPQKKLDILLKAVCLLRENGENYNIVFIGDGEEKDNLSRKSVELNIEDRVWFYGECYGQLEIANLVFNSEMCVAPGNIGLTAIHAMMFGCPCISHNDLPKQMPEYEAIIENKTGLLFNRNSVESLAETISKWYSTNGDRREEIRQNCYSEIDNNWNPHMQVRIIKNVITKL